MLRPPPPHPHFRISPLFLHLTQILRRELMGQLSRQVEGVIKPKCLGRSGSPLCPLSGVGGNWHLNQQHQL